MPSLCACGLNGFVFWMSLPKHGHGFVRFIGQDFRFLCPDGTALLFSLVPKSPSKPAGMLCGVSFAGPLPSALKWASRVGGHVPGGLLPGG